MQSPNERNFPITANLTDAIRLAVLAHGQTMDKAGHEPYILHPIRVMLKQDTEHGRMAGVLHDVVEDTPTTLRDLQEQGFPAPVIHALRLLTHDDDTPYPQYIERLAGDELARKVKIADLEDNMDIRRLDRLAEKDFKRLAKYQAAWAKLAARGRTVNDTLLSAKPGSAAPSTG